MDYVRACVVCVRGVAQAVWHSVCAKAAVGAYARRSAGGATASPIWAGQGRCPLASWFLEALQGALGRSSRSVPGLSTRLTEVGQREALDVPPPTEPPHSRS